MKKCAMRIGIMVMLAISFTGCAARTAAGESGTVLPKELSAPVLTVGETVTIDGVCEFQIDSVAMTEKPELFFEAENGKIYVDFCITYKHLASGIKNVGDVMEGRLVYSGQYEYDGIDIVAGEEGNSWNYAHTEEMWPSATRQVHYLFNVPKEVQDSGRMVELAMQIGGNDYLVIVREGDKGSVTDSKGVAVKTSGAVTDGEVVRTENAEFYVEYAVFAETVLPQNPGVGYNYFTADDGKVCLDFCIVYRNLSAKTIMASEAVSAKLEQADARTSVAEESGRSMFDYASLVKIIPLCTGYVHYIFQVPEEVETGSEEVMISFTIDGNKYTYSVK